MTTGGFKNKIMFILKLLEILFVLFNYQSHYYRLL